MLPVPAISASDQLLSLTENFDRIRRPRNAVPLPEQAPWPRDTTLHAMTNNASLPVPASDLFEISERRNQPINALIRLPHHAQQTVPVRGAASDAIGQMIDASAARRTIPGAIPPGLHPTAAAAPR
jgi:hypothetical protein